MSSFLSRLQTNATDQRHRAILRDLTFGGDCICICVCGFCVCVCIFGYSGTRLVFFEASPNALRDGSLKFMNGMLLDRDGGLLRFLRCNGKYFY